MFGDEQPTSGASVAAQARPQVDLRVDADANPVPCVRVVAADLATRADFDLDTVADLRLAVDEVCATLLESARPGSQLRCQLALTSEQLVVTVRVAVTAPTAVSTRTFGWRVLSRLADEVQALDSEPAETGNGSRRPEASLGIRLVKHRRAGP